MSYITAYGSCSAAGNTTDALWSTLLSGHDCSSPTGFYFAERKQDLSILDLLTSHLVKAFTDMKVRPTNPTKLGVILASTKGINQDFNYRNSSTELNLDPVTPLLTNALRALELSPARALCVSNACSSGLAALRLAQSWLKQDLDDVLILSADAVTPFVQSGFASLKVLSSKRPRPFHRDRDGFLLGEAASVIWLSKRETEFHLRTVGLDSEGSVVTRPGRSNESLKRAILRIPSFKSSPPDVIFAHGTATVINDQTEDLVFSDLLPSVPVTASKWAIGHTLGASAGIDVILACEALRRGQVFSLQTTEVLDESLKAKYLLNTSEPPPRLERVLVSSLGFGGMHAAALIEKARPQ